MTRNSKSFKYLLISLLVLMSVTIIQLFPYNSNEIVGNTDDTKSEIKVKNNAPIYVPFEVGVYDGPHDLDPVDSWDFDSWDVLDQVCEGLFRYNFSDPDLTRINWLAESYWWENKTSLQLKLRVGVLFHDGTPFNSSAAKWNLDRINYLTNVTGTLPITMNLAKTESLWKFNNGTGIMKQIDIISEYNITVHLNSPYAPFLDLLCFTGAYMISPSSHSQTDYIDTLTGDLIGTGPFEYDEYIDDVEVKFHTFDFYWRGKANITKMVYTVIIDDNARNDAMLAGTIDFLNYPSASYYSSFAVDPNIMLAEAPNPGLTYYYLAFNINQMVETWASVMAFILC